MSLRRISENPPAVFAQPDAGTQPRHIRTEAEALTSSPRAPCSVSHALVVKRACLMPQGFVARVRRVLQVREPLQE